MKPFLNWAGGKRWLVAHHADVFPSATLRHVEPFVGSGAVFFQREPGEALLSDYNSQLIDAYIAVRDDPEAVLAALRRHKLAHSKDYYYQVRAMRPRAAATSAARLIYLNRTCWNGLYRVNLKGEFNVPKGSKDSVLFPDDDFAAWSKVLAGTTLVARDFEQTVEQANAGDFLYVDPPYTVQHNMNNFVKYNEHIFSWADQERLASCLHSASARGAHILISNADHESIHRLYAHSAWVIERVVRKSRLAADSSRRGGTTEVIISNYLEPGRQLSTPRSCTPG